MKYEIDDAIIKATTKCEKNHVCLESADPLYCSVEHCLMHRIYYVKCLYEGSCPYKETLDQSTICTCPVRKEIFNRYGE
jgi:hypothetical protein